MCQFGQLIIRKIIETVANLSHILQLQFNAANSISVGAALQTPLRELTALPRPPTWILGGPTSKESEGRERGEKGKRRGGNEKGEEREADPSLPLPNPLCYWVRRALRGVGDSG